MIYISLYIPNTHTHTHILTCFGIISIYCRSVFVFVFTSIQMCNIIVNLFCVWLLLSACTYESENKISLEIESMCAWANIGRKSFCWINCATIQTNNCSENYSQMIVVTYMFIALSLSHTHTYTQAKCIQFY